MDPDCKNLGERFKIRFKENTEWFKFYGYVREEISVDAHLPCGKEVEINSLADVEHTGDNLNTL